MNPMTVFRYGDYSLTITTPPPNAPKGAALLSINDWSFGLARRTVVKLADVMRRRSMLTAGLDPDANITLWVKPDDSAGVTLTVMEHGTATDVRLTVPAADVPEVAAALDQVATRED